MAKTGIEKFFGNKYVQLAALAAGALALARSWKTSGTSESTNGVGYIVDEDAVRDILLWFENDIDLYHRYEEPLRRQLVKKMLKGVELSEDHLANSSTIDTIVRETIRSYARSLGWPRTVNTETRKAMKREIAHSIMLAAQDDYEYELNNA